ncbi:MAG: SusD/RagB family nutrient-binding outer membrane lipoprotein [Arcicella sp.]|nr:SusD/RagB family nutrient-binding outer membrane lipoprotein [Arcicella sp.]
MTTDITPALYTQQFGDVTYIEESRYKTINFNYNGFYAGPLNAYQNIIDLNTNPDTKTAAAANGSNNNQIALARIAKAYTYLWITDRWGDVPYSEALKGRLISPPFDSQQAIYTDLFKELKEAQAQFDGGKAVVGDILLSTEMLLVGKNLLILCVWLWLFVCRKLTLPRVKQSFWLQWLMVA